MNRRNLLSLIPGLPFLGMTSQEKPVANDPKPDLRLSDDDVQRIAKAVAFEILNTPIAMTSTTITPVTLTGKKWFL